MDKLIEKIFGDVGFVLRHVLTGALVLLAVYTRWPQWFVGLQPWPSAGQLVVLGVIGVALGNLAYTFNRYVVLHLLEYIVFCCCRGKRLCKPILLWHCYVKQVCKEIRRYYPSDAQQGTDPSDAQQGTDAHKDFRHLMKWRDSSSVYLLVGGESAMFCSLGDLFTVYERRWVLVAGIVMLVVGGCMYLMNRRMVRRLFLPSPEQSSRIVQ